MFTITIERKSEKPLAARVAATLATWSARRRQRRRLAELPERLLRDVGLDRTAAAGEARKPFWRP